MKLLKEILSEIGEGGASPYELKLTHRAWAASSAEFKTDSGERYKVSGVRVDDKNEQNEIEDEMRTAYGEEVDLVDGWKIIFATVDDWDYSDYSATPNKGELYRVMSTISKFVKEEIKGYHGGKYILFSVTGKFAGVGGYFKGVSQKKNLYIKFIEKQGGRVIGSVNPSDEAATTVVDIQSARL